MSRWKRFIQLSNKRANAPISQTHPFFVSVITMAGFAFGWAAVNSERDFIIDMALVGAIAAAFAYAWNFYKKAWSDSAQEKSDPQ
ncbi:hypothetical protein RHODOSMS8_00959 [Rhodobiaceae bacterium]|nr:hypothetical protein RHODOSMS8_00959 [Rhodobiaceae bacterium]